MEKKELNLQEIHTETLGVLKKIIEICEKINVNYTVMYGTLLGAIRHKGYIPWDDDMDICILRPDFEKFVDYCHKHEKELMPYKLISRRYDKAYPFSFPRFCDTRYELVSTEGLDASGMGLFIDVYPLDAIGSDKAEKAKIEKIKTRLMLCIGCAHSKHIMGTSGSFIKGLLRLPVYIYSHIKGADYFINKFEALKDMYNYEDSKYVGELIWDKKLSYFEKESFVNVTKAQFEDIEVSIPTNADAILTEEYGDYMQLPPEEKRVPYHEYKIYRK